MLTPAVREDRSWYSWPSDPTRTPVSRRTSHSYRKLVLVCWETWTTTTGSPPTRAGVPRTAPRSVALVTRQARRARPF
jgi:hypothetical protein